MSNVDSSKASTYVHPEVRLRIANKEFLENARRVFELCEELQVDPDSLTPDWSKADIGITQDVIENAPKKLLSGGGKLERLMAIAEMLEFHIKKHVLLMKKIEDVGNEKIESDRPWVSSGMFHWCPNCDQIFGSDVRDDAGKMQCTQCGHYGIF